MSELRHGAVPAVNGDRLWRSLEEHATVGGLDNGGICREALTETDRRGRDRFAEWCRDAGMTVTVDAIGNMFARRAGSEPELLPVAIGSHLDTQPSGGKFDGVLGVLGGLEVVRCLNEAGIRTRRGIELVNWTGEEGSRFKTSMLGSGAWAGIISMTDALGERDEAGVSVAEALAATGYAGTETVGQRRFHCHLELHIEQGPILECSRKDIGVVTGSQAMSWNEVIVEGRTAHAGTTPMAERLDPLRAALRMLLPLFSLADATPDARVTVGSISTTPSSHSTVPGEVRFLLDVRHHDPKVLASLLASFDGAAEVERSAGHGVQRREYGSTPAQAFDRELVSMIRDAAAQAGYSAMDIVSGAGHDAIYVNHVCPSAMIFVPCWKGVSHHPSERITPEQAHAGVSVLLGAVLRAAE